MELEHLNMAALNELKEVMEDDFNLLVDTYISDSIKRVADIKEAFKQADADRLSKAAHGLKGSCSNIGATCLYEICKEIEVFARNNELQKTESFVNSLDSEFVAVSSMLAAFIKAS